MAVTKAQQKATAKYVKENYGRIELQVPKALKDEIKLRAVELGLSVNSYLQQLVKLDLGKDVK